MCLNSILNNTKDFIFIPEWMSNAMSAWIIWDNYDDCLDDFENACGIEHVHKYKGECIYPIALNDCLNGLNQKCWKSFFRIINTI